jgi:hypothetical protein
VRHRLTTFDRRRKRLARRGRTEVDRAAPRHCSWSSRYDRAAFVRLLLGFFLVAGLAAWAAWLVWNASMFGAVLTFVLLPAEGVFWFGFDLPIPKVIGLMRMAALALGWSSLT